MRARRRLQRKNRSAVATRMATTPPATPPATAPTGKDALSWIACGVPEGVEPSAPLLGKGCPPSPDVSAEAAPEPVSEEDTVVEEPVAVKEDVAAVDAVDMATVELDNAVAVDELEDMPIMDTADEGVMDDWAASSNV